MNDTTPNRERTSVSYIVTVTNDGNEAVWDAEDVQTILLEGDRQPYIAGLRVEAVEI